MISLRGFLLALLSFGCLVLGVSSGPAALAATVDEAAVVSSYDDSSRDYDQPVARLSSPTSPASRAIRGYDDDANPSRARNTSAASILAAGVGAALPRLPSALAKGPKNVHVYRGVDEAGNPAYVGVSNNLSRRAAQHGDRFSRLDPVTTTPVTRGEARAIEQALILRNPSYQNQINAISPNRPFYDEAVAYGEAWLRNAGL